MRGPATLFQRQPVTPLKRNSCRNVTVGFNDPGTIRSPAKLFIHTLESWMGVIKVLLNMRIIDQENRIVLPDLNPHQSEKYQHVVRRPESAEGSHHGKPAPDPADATKGQNAAQ